jgi:uncharacterized membrane protein YhhN
MNSFYFLLFMNRDSLFTVIYFVIVVAVLIAGQVGDQEVRYWLKPMIMISLLMWSFISQDRRPVQRKVLFQVGMFFACLGDCFLMFKGYFLTGLVAFLVMQVAYILTFLPEVSLAQGGAGVGRKLFVALVLGGGILWVVFPHLSELSLRVGVPVYALTITCMAFVASLRSNGVSRSSYRWVVVGALLFLLSDTLIAINSFVHDVRYHHFFIMTTYTIAQYCIVKGMLKTR